MKDYNKYLLYLTAIVLAGCKKRKKTPATISTENVENIENEAELETKSEEADVSEELQEAPVEKSVATHFYFAFDSSYISSSDKEEIKEMYASLVDSESNIVIYGNCDQVGSKAYNMGLGTRRAAAVREVLISMGVKASRIKIISLGQTILVEGDSQEAYAKNRVAIIEIDGKVGGEIFEKRSENSSLTQKNVEKAEAANEASEEDEDDEDDSDN